MSKHESFKDQIIEVPISKHEKTIKVREPFWKSLLDQGVSVVILHNDEPHVTDPRNNNRKVKLARLVMECEAGYTAKPKDPNHPFDLLPTSLEVVKDGRAKYPAFIGAKPPRRDWRQVHPDQILVDVETFAVTFKDAPGLYGLGKSSSRRVSSAPPWEDDQDGSADLTKKETDDLYKVLSREKGKVLPDRGKTYKRWSLSHMSGGRTRNESSIKFTKRKGIPD